MINRGRQYGKTTTLKALSEYLAEDYTVLSMDFQRISSAGFAERKSLKKQWKTRKQNWRSRDFRR